MRTASFLIALLLTLASTPRAVVHAAEASAPAGNSRIDRHAVVARHDIIWNDVSGRLPLGNGEFCFGADGTGLQTFAGNSMSHWGWHSFPLPQGWISDRVPATGTFQKGRCTGGDQFPAGTDTIRTWMFDNPHIMNLGRLRLVRREGRSPRARRHQGLGPAARPVDGHADLAFIASTAKRCVS